MTKELAAVSAVDDDGPIIKPPVVIDPSVVVQNYAGFAFNEYLVRLPIDAVADDLNSNRDMWRKVQKSNHALVKFDRLFIISYDETWTAECFVAQANGQSVTLSKPRISALPERGEKLLNDGTYRISWNGAGYVVIRIRDNFKVDGPFANAVLAERALAQMYPKRA